jgi:SAM-dependent methyltransferase
MEQDEVLRYFDRRLDEFGATVEAVDWGSADSQRARFAALAAVGALDGCRVLDVGCGLGDFCGYLERVAKGVDYQGGDLNPRMVAAAAGRYPAHRFAVLDLLKEDPPGGSYDYVVASGLFYLRDEQFQRAMVGRMFECCRQAVAFNSLSAWADRRDPGEYYADPARVLDFCHRLTRRVVLRHDYLPNDFTVYAYRDA